jgi:hypothetical protein
MLELMTRGGMRIGAVLKLTMRDIQDHLLSLEGSVDYLVLLFIQTMLQMDFCTSTTLT